MNSKQKICAIAAGVMAVSSVMPAGVLGADYSKELQEAYKWAYENGVTTMNTIDQANMYGNLTRIAMAKMLANYAINNLGKKPDTSIDCSFPDVSSAMDKAYDNGVTNACQLGIMGQGITNFDPNGTVTRAQFGTALSRLLWGDKNNASDEEQRAGVQYYKYHLSALNKSYNGVTIMKDISNPSQNEVRGYVMLMLQRSAGMVGKSTEECTATQQLLCLLEGNCTSACEEAMKDINNGSDEEDENTTTNDKVKSGKLVVTNEKNEGGVVISKGYTSDLDTITLSSDEEVTIDSITFERMGLSNSNAIDSIWLETEEWKEVTSKKSVNSKDTVSLSINKDYRTVKGDVNFVVVVKTMNTGSQDLWTNIGFKVTDIQSSAKTVKNNADKVNLYSFIDYTANGITIENKGSSTEKTYDYAEWEMYEVAKMKITSKDVAVKVEGFTLTNNSWVDLDDVDEVEVLVDGTAIKGVKSSVKKDDLTITFPEQEIALKSNSIFTVRVSLKNFEDFGQSIKFSAKTSDIIASEVKNNVRVKINDGSEDLNFSLYTFRGNKIEFTNTKLSSTIDIAQSWEGVIAKGTIKVNGQSVKVNTKEVALTFGTYTGTDLKDIIDYIELSVNGVSEAEIAWKSFTSNGTNVFTGNFKNFVIDEDSDIELIVHLDTKAPQNDTIAVTISGSSIINTDTLGLTYDDVKGSKEANALGSITINSVKVQSAKASLTNDVSKTVEFNTKKTEEKTVFEGTYTAKKQNVKLNEIGITRQFDGSLTGSDVEFNIYVNNKNVASISDKNFKNNSGTQSETFSDIVVDAWQTAAIKVIAKVYAFTGSDKLSYSIQLSGEDSNNNPVATSSISMADMKFVDTSSVTTTSNAATKQKDVILADKNQEVAHFIVKPANKAEKANISSVSISGSINFKETANKNVEDYFEIKIGGTDYADEFDFASDNIFGANWVISTNDLDIDITGETEVIVKAKAELSGTGANINVAINGTKYESTRKVVPAIVRIVAQESVSDKTYTKYTFDVDFAGDYNTISGLNLTFEDNTVTGQWNTISENDTKSVKNASSSKELKSISYEVVGYTEAITITKDVYSDFFEIKGTPIVSFANN